MSLPRRHDVYLQHKCPQCGTGRANTERWFYAIASYTCEGCGKKVRVTYDEKLRLLGDRKVAVAPMGETDPRLSSGDHGSVSPPATES
jgi:predicted RNA-binding Zn-ribbon protein involved in translation (DUF1610 family)